MFIESLCRVKEPSVTGKLSVPVFIVFLSVEIFCSISMEKRRTLGERLLIFVTVGNHDQGFERLIRKMDEIAGNR